MICRLSFKSNPNQRLNNHEASQPEKKISSIILERNRTRVETLKKNDQYAKTCVDYPHALNYA